MKNLNNKGSIVLMLSLIIIVLLVIIGYFLYVNNILSISKTDKNNSYSSLSSVDKERVLNISKQTRLNVVMADLRSAIDSYHSFYGGYNNLCFPMGETKNSILVGDSYKIINTEFGKENTFCFASKDAYAFSARTSSSSDFVSCMDSLGYVGTTSSLFVGSSCGEDNNPATVNDQSIKAQSATIKVSLSNIRSQAALVYDTQNSYGKMPFKLSNCSQNQNTLFADKGIVASLNIATNNNISLASCVSEGEVGQVNSFAVSVPLPDKNGYSWCVDAQGNSMQIPGIIKSSFCK